MARGGQEETLASKPNNIRKKALEYAKKGHWEKALEEFLRLVEVEQHNPNLFNEIGDIQLKLANKREAFRQYHAAIAAYERVGLLNNAIAVCKKILRLNPADDVVYGRMATLRQSQGFGREAAAYALQFLERVIKRPDAADENVRSIVIEIVRSVADEPDVLERAAECLAAWDAANDACDALEKLEKIYLGRGMTAERERAMAKMKSLGRATAGSAAARAEPSRNAEKQQTIETHRPSSGAAAPGFDTPFNKTVPSHIRRGHTGDAASDFGVIEVGGDRSVPAEESSVPLPSGSGCAEGESMPQNARAAFDPDPSVLTAEPPAAPAAAPSSQRPEAEDEEPAPVKEYEIPAEDAGRGLDEAFRVDSAHAPADVPSGGTEADPAAEVKADVEAGDYRSHYDLGMAYLEMNLLPEAIREFQVAAQSPVFKVRSLEMIGRCFLTQKQPDLAIKQLTMGLALVDGDERSALGIKYSLAIAYEMTGEPEKARAFFRDVYIVDGSFRDVGERIRKYAS